MKAKNIIVVGVVVVVLISIFYSIQGSQDQTAYIQSIDKEREEKDRFMRENAESPFAGATADFKGLQYFPADIKYKVTASLEPVKDKKPVLLTTSDGKEQRYLEYAYASFELDGQPCKLLILEIIDMGPFRGKLFLAFGDNTSAGETYGAGRYLDVAKAPGSNSLMLDFNKAYNPYCAYSEKFSCPLPPRENLLTVAIRAGEKTYHE